jgi:3-phytase
VAPFAETPSLVAGHDDDADDAAIHRSGFVVATSKAPDGGLEVYDGRARRVQFLQRGPMNNVDVRGDVVFATNRRDHRIERFSLRSGRLTPAGAFAVPFEPYGLCLYRDTVVVTSVDIGRVVQYSASGQTLRELRGPQSQSEGCVADERRHRIYIAEEAKGIWRFAAEPRGDAAGRLIAGLGDGLREDVEGLAVARGRLIASSQGDSTFAVFRGDRLRARFRVGGRGRIDAVQSTDGVAASASLDLLVLHDGRNTGGTSSNFKFVRLSQVPGL